MLTSLRSRIPKEVIAVCTSLRKVGHQAYLVGGAIRDLLRLPDHTEAAQDFDIATSARPEEVIRIFGQADTVPTGLKHGTVTVLLPPKQGKVRTKKEHVEVTTFRKESGYTDGRRPEQVDFLEDLTQDLERRDFTMNAIAYDPSLDQVIDPFCGQNDIQARLIRAVGEPKKRFLEDGLRPLRAIRFSAQLGFSIEEATLRAIPSTLTTFRKVSQERIREELLKLLCGKNTKQGLFLLEQSSLLGEIFPEFPRTLPSKKEEIYSSISRLPFNPILRLTGLLAGYLSTLQESPGYRQTLEEITLRLRLSAYDRNRILTILLSPRIDKEGSFTPYDIRKFLSQMPKERALDLLALLRSEEESRTSTEPSLLKQKKRFEEFEEKVIRELEKNPPLSVSDLALTGEDLMKILQIPPGKQVGERLKKLLDCVLQDPSLNTKELLIKKLTEAEHA